MPITMDIAVKRPYRFSSLLSISFPLSAVRISDYTITVYYIIVFFYNQPICAQKKQKSEYIAAKRKTVMVYARQSSSFKYCTASAQKSFFRF